jgi:hypothetical protein
MSCCAFRESGFKAEHLVCMTQVVLIVVFLPSLQFQVKQTNVHANSKVICVWLCTLPIQMYMHTNPSIYKQDELRYNTTNPVLVCSQLSTFKFVTGYPS